MKALAMCASVCLLAAAPAFAVEAKVYIELDGRWYQTEVGSPFITLQTPLWLLRGARMDLCNRLDGQTQVVGGAYYAYVGAFSVPVYQLTSWRVHRPASVPGYTVIELNSLPGNIGCLYEVPSPIPNRIFQNGFEVDRIRVDGFDSATAAATQSPLTITLNTPSGTSCIFTANGDGLHYSPGSPIRATGDFACGVAGGDGYGSGWMLAGPTTWNVAIPWRVGQPRTVNWYAYPAASCTVTVQPLSGQPVGSMTLAGPTTCSGVGTSSGQPNASVCWNVSRALTMTAAASGAYLFTLSCQRGDLQKTDQRTLVVSPAL